MKLRDWSQRFLWMLKPKERENGLWSLLLTAESFIVGCLSAGHRPVTLLLSHLSKLDFFPPQTISGLLSGGLVENGLTGRINITEGWKSSLE